MQKQINALLDTIAGLIMRGASTDDSTVSEEQVRYVGKVSENPIVYQQYLILYKNIYS